MAELNASCTRRPLAGSAVRRNPQSTQFGTWPGNEVPAGQVTAIHAEMGVHVTEPPARTESSIPVPMATNPVTCQLAFNAMNPQLEVMRPIAPDGLVALHFIHLVIFAQRMHPIHQTLDDYVWVATLGDNWGVDLWPAMFTQASEPDLSTMTYLCELIRSNLLRNMDSDATPVDVSRVVSILVGSLVVFVDPNDPERARFQQLNQPANAHREARTHTVLIADTGPRSPP
eukprot:2330572-Pleurochrysis_carterae.AAC.2